MGLVALEAHRDGKELGVHEVNRVLRVVRALAVLMELVAKSRSAARAAIVGRTQARAVVVVSRRDRYLCSLQQQPYVPMVRMP